MKKSFQYIYQKARIIFFLFYSTKLIKEFLLASFLNAVFFFIVLVLFNAPVSSWNIIGFSFWGIELIIFGMVWIRNYKYFLASNILHRVKNHLINHLQNGEKFIIVEELQNIEASNPFSKIAIRKIISQLDEVEIQEYLSNLKKQISIFEHLRSSLIIGVFWVGLMISSDTLSVVLTHPTADFATQAYKVKNLTDTRDIFEGDSIKFVAKVSDQNVGIWLKILDPSSGQLLYNEKMIQKDSVFVSSRIPVSQNIEYYFELIPLLKQYNEKYASKLYFVRVKPKPELDFISFSIIPPGYTQIEPYELYAEKSRIFVPEFSKIILKATCNDSLQYVELNLNSKLKKIDRFEETRNLQYEFTLKDTSGLNLRFQVKNSNRWFQHPIHYSLIPEKDKYPEIIILSPNKEIPLDENLKARIPVQINDDYGISTFAGFYQKNVSGKPYAGAIRSLVMKAPLNKQAKSQKIYVDISLFNAFPVPGDKFNIWFKVRDNNPFRNQWTISDTLIVYLPGLEEILARNNLNLDSIASQKEKLMEKLKSNITELEEIKKEFLKKGKLGQKEKQKLKKIIRESENLQKELQQLSKQMEKTVNELQQQNVLSQETLKKYFELQEMFKKMASEDLKNLIEQLKKLMNEKSAKNQKNQIQDAAFSLEDFEKQIDRLYELFQKTRLEQKLDELKKLSQSMVKQLNEVLKGSSIDKRQINYMKEKHQNFIQQSTNAAGEMKTENKKISQKLDSLSHELKKKKYAEQLSEEIEQPENTRGTLSKMEQTYNQIGNELEKITSEYKNQKKNQIRYEIKAILADLLIVSSRQKQLQEDLNEINRFSKVLDILSIKQRKISDFLKRSEQKLLELSQKSFLFNPMIYQFIKQASNGMEQNIADIEQRMTFNLKKNMIEIRRNLNLGIYFLLEMDKQVSQSASGSGLEEFMQQMEKMIQQQTGINQQTMNLYEQLKQTGRLTPGQRETLRRLQQQQEAIQRSMEYMKNARQGAGNQTDHQMKGIQEELKKVVDDLKRYKLDRKLIERQQKVLNRMLSATQSLREKDVSRKREAEIARDYRAQPQQNHSIDTQYKNEIIEFLQKINNLNLDPTTKKLLQNYYEELLEK